MIPYSLEDNLLILNLIKHRRIQLQEERESFKKTKISERQLLKITSELEDLRRLEISNRGYRL